MDKKDVVYIYVSKQQSKEFENVADVRVTNTKGKIEVQCQSNQGDCQLKQNKNKCSL